MSRRSKIGFRIAVVTLAALAVLSMAGCDFLFDLIGGDATGTVSGLVWDSTTGYGIAGVVVSVVGSASYSTTTDAGGSFVLEVPARSITLHFVLSGYEFSDVTVTVTEDDTTVLDYSLTVGNPPLASGEYRFVLTWGIYPDDLDSHLITPGDLHVYFADDAPIGAGAYLDVDDTSSYGPETITIDSVQAGTYHYYVYDYDQTGELTSSDAQVRVYSDSGYITTYYVPTFGTGDYWDVFSLTNGVFSTVNLIRDSDPYPSLVGPALSITK